MVQVDIALRQCDSDVTVEDSTVTSQTTQQQHTSNNNNNALLPDHKHSAMMSIGYG